jgi:hypothetical protein
MPATKAVTSKGPSAVTEMAIGLGLGLIGGAIWKSWSFGSKARLDDYYKNK